MKKKTAWPLILCVLTGSTFAYDPTTHSIIADYAMQRSTLNDPQSGMLESLGLGENVDDKKFLLPSTFPYPLTLTPMRLVRLGVQAEDEGSRALRTYP